MPIFQWSPQLETGDAEVDGQHRRLVELIGALSRLLEERHELEPDALAPVRDELFEYARHHFRTEEGLMVAGGADPRHQEAHRREHREFVAQVETMVAHPVGDPLGAARALLAYLVHWLTYHILGTDHALVRQLQAIARGRTPAEALAEAERGGDPATGTLLASMRALFETLVERNRALTVLADTLEARVRERTEALTAANAELRDMVQQVERLALTDALTALPNRRYAMQALSRGWAGASRWGRAMSVLLVNADAFKPVNDEHGHEAGDVVLRTLATALRNCVRGYDEVCRLGGDEFLVIALETSLEGALALAERLRATIAALEVPVGDRGVWRGSVSIGVASRGPGVADVETLLRAADEGVYAAKRAGKNAVRACQPAEPWP